MKKTRTKYYAYDTMHTEALLIYKYEHNQWYAFAWIDRVWEPTVHPYMHGKDMRRISEIEMRLYVL